VRSEGGRLFEVVLPKSLRDLEIFCEIFFVPFWGRELPWLKLIGQANNCNS